MFRQTMVLLLISCGPVVASDSANAGGSSEALPPAPASAHTAYTTAETPIGALLDDPAAKSVLDQHVPKLTGDSQLAMARSMTLKQIQPYASDVLSDEVLGKIDADLAKLSTKK